MKKSVLILGNYPPPYGGVPRHIECLGPYLVRKGWDVHILSSGRTGVEYKNGCTVYKLNRAAKILSLIKFTFRKKQKVGFNFNALLKNHLKEYLGYKLYIAIGCEIIERNNVSVISAYNLASYAPIGAALSEMYGIPLVATNFGEIYSMQEYLKKNMGLIAYICRMSRKLLAMSHHCAQSYKLLGLSPNVDVIPYGVDLDKFSPNNDGGKIRHALGIDRESAVVLFLGRLIKDMGLNVFLDAIPEVLKKNEKIRFVIAGEKGDLFTDALNLSGKYPGNVFVVPSVTFNELPFYYAASTVVAAPTQGERACGSLAAIEAMASGKPVIAARVGGIPEIVIDKETGLLIPRGNSVALAEAIINLLQDDAAVKKMGASGRARAKQYFNKEESDQRIEQIFADLAVNQ